MGIARKYTGCRRRRFRLLKKGLSDDRNDIGGVVTVATLDDAVGMDAVTSLCRDQQTAVAMTSIQLRG